MSEEFTSEENEVHEESIVEIEQKSSFEDEEKRALHNYTVCLKEDAEQEDMLFKYWFLYFAGQSMSTEAREILKPLVTENSSIVAWGLGELYHTHVPFKHAFGLMENISIWSPLRRMPSKHNGIVRKKIDVMLVSRIINHATSPWGFSVMIVKKKDGSSRFCLGYRALNKK